MFNELIEKLDAAVRKLRGIGKLTEKNISESLREIRRVLLEADVNYKVVKDFISRVQEKAVGEDVIKSVTPGQQVVKIVHEELEELLGKEHTALRFNSVPPTVIMAVGLQGSGKTTFVARLGYYLHKKGHQSLLVAADIYRPAAIQQLQTLAKSVNLSVYAEDSNDPITIIKNAFKYARKNAYDVIILDTAGRLHIDKTMMEELQNIRKAVNPAEILFVADSMTGQDAVRSALSFQEMLDFDGIVLTKLDGDAKGGAALSIRAVTGKPIKFVTSGEKLDALEPFHADRMASRILGLGDVVTLVEKAQEVVDKDKAEKLAKKIKEQEFDLEDFRDQLTQVKKMGSMGQLASMIPGLSPKANLQMDDVSVKRVEAIIDSMTREERQKPHIINGSRRKRIASGSGTSVQEVNRLLKQFQMMQKMMKQMHRFGKMRMPTGLPFEL